LDQNNNTLFTFTITKKNINSKSRGQLTAFYTRTTNETSTTKNTKRGIIGAYLHNFLKRELEI
jgi:hypothetical protein